MPKKTSHQGQALLDIIVATGVFLILVHAVFSLVIVIYETMGYARTRLSARHLATQKLETLVNLPYNDLGTTSGIPTGIIAEFEKVSRNGLNYTVHTTITYQDDPFDDTAPDDLLPTDYKQVRVEVTWDGQFSSRVQPLVLVSNIAPQGIETSVGGGTLSVFVIDGQAQPVMQAQVHITNADVNPNIDMTLQTNDEGRVILPGAPTCATCYHIEISKDNYTSDKTYIETEVTNPNQRPVTIAEGAFSEAVFVIDRVSKLTVSSHNSRAQVFASFPNASFRLTGSKTIGTDSGGESVFKYDHTLATDATGVIVLENMEWDNYIMTLPAVDYDLVSSNPHQPFVLDPNQDEKLKFALAAHTNHSLLISLKDASGSAVASASAVLNLAPDFEASQSSGLVDDPDFGQVFFPDLSAAIYDFTIAHPNFDTQTGQISVSGTTTDSLVLNNE